jgi:hypothetical protein
VCCVAQHSTNGLDLVVVYSVVLVYGHRVMPSVRGPIDRIICRHSTSLEGTRVALKRKTVMVL